MLSIVVPVYNEEDNVRPLFEKIQAVCETIGDAYEVLFIDDGSDDETFNVLSELCKQEPQLVVIRFDKNAGQTAAMAAGFEFARGERIVIWMAICKTIDRYTNSLKNLTKVTTWSAAGGKIGRINS